MQKSKASTTSSEHLKCKKKIKHEPEIQYVKTVPQHSRDQLSRRLKKKPANKYVIKNF